VDVHNPTKKGVFGETLSFVIKGQFYKISDHKVNYNFNCKLIGAYYELFMCQYTVN